MNCTKTHFKIPGMVLRKKIIFNLKLKKILAIHNCCLFSHFLNIETPKSPTLRFVDSLYKCLGKSERVI